ncbi:PQQ-binding-like beta-propeller repeat protein [Candidatus Poribacteria bacterium]|nr:PQQ-binding-like beta-propeller repeat protein [Candidatus Poribacteria bacterium]
MYLAYEKSISKDAKTIIICLIFALFLVNSISYADDWPQWRGPNYNGISKETHWNYKWSQENPKILWSKSLGFGYSSFTVSEGRLYTMGNKYNTDTVYCLNAETGETIWDYSYKCRQGSWKGPRIAPTIDDGKAYVMSREGQFFCLNAASGELLWSENLKKKYKAKIPNHGLACHPFIVNDMVIVEIGAKDGSILALDKNNGKLIWQSGSEKPGYSTPMLYRLKDKEYMVVFTGTAVLGMNPADGKQLWRYEWKTPYECSIATPIVDKRKIFVSAGYNMGGALFYITDANKPEVVWKNMEMANHMNPCIPWKGNLYGFHGAPKHNNDKGQLRCLDFNTGEVMWKQDGLGKGSLTMADGKLIILTEDGELVIAEASQHEFKELARTKVLYGTCWTVPVISNGKIYCRNHEGQMICVDVSRG